VFDLETSTVRRPRPALNCCGTKKRCFKQFNNEIREARHFTDSADGDVCNLAE
jgi:hypothetical protein